MLAAVGLVGGDIAEDFGRTCALAFRSPGWEGTALGAPMVFWKVEMACWPQYEWLSSEGLRPPPAAEAAVLGVPQRRAYPASRRS